MPDEELKEIRARLESVRLLHRTGHDGENNCEHCLGKAPECWRFCSNTCFECERTYFDEAKGECAGLCGGGMADTCERLCDEVERLRVALRTSLVSKELHGDLPIYKCGDIELMKTESGWSLYPPRHGEPLRGLSEFHSTADGSTARRIWQYSRPRTGGRCQMSESAEELAEEIIDDLGTIYVTDDARDEEIAMVAASIKARDAATRRAVLEDACEAMCPNCARGWPLTKTGHLHPQSTPDAPLNHGCDALPLRALMEEPTDE